MATRKDRARPRVVIITQARMGSTRLPGKVMEKAAGVPLLAHHLRRLARVRGADKVVVATTTGNQEAPIIELCAREGVPVFRGPEDDVLARYWLAAREHDADVVVRVTSDCPLIEPAVVTGLIEKFLGPPQAFDYVANFHNRDRTYPLGFEAEVLSFAALDAAYREATEKLDREHVTPFVWRQPERFYLAAVPYMSNQSAYRLTVDTPQDLELIRRILDALPGGARSEFTLEDVLALLAQHPDWSLINADVKQKYYG